MRVYPALNRIQVENYALKMQVSGLRQQLDDVMDDTRVRQGTSGLK